VGMKNNWDHVVCPAQNLVVYYSENVRLLLRTREAILEDNVGQVNQTENQLEMESRGNHVEKGSLAEKESLAEIENHVEMANHVEMENHVEMVSRAKMESQEGRETLEAPGID
jgi:hypothetical protein